MMPFDEGYESTIGSMGMPSSEVQKRVIINDERIKHLYSILLDMKEELITLKKPVTKKTVKPKTTEK